MGEVGEVDAVALARALTGVLETVRHRVGTGIRSELVERITGHIGSRLADIPNVALSLQSWEHVNLHGGATAYVAQHSPDAVWFGVGGAGRNHQDLVDLLSGADQHGAYQLGAVDYTTLAAGPDRVVDAVQLGFVATTAPDGRPVVLGVRGGMEQYGCLPVSCGSWRATARPPRSSVTRSNGWLACTMCSVVRCSPST